MDLYRRFNARFCWVLAISFSLFELYTVGFGILAPFAQRATMLLFAALLVVGLYPTANWASDGNLTLVKRLGAIVWDVFLVVLSLVTCIYLIVNEADLADRSGAETQTDLIIAALGPIVILDMVRRVAGIPLFLVTFGVVCYAYFGDLVLVIAAALIGVETVRRFAGTLPAVIVLMILCALYFVPGLSHFWDPAFYAYKGAAHDRLAAYLWLTNEGTFGSILGIMTEFIFIFILFSAVLEATGAGQILMDLAFALTGRYRGGPAQSAVVASSMFGMVSGSTMANVVSTGTFTIPLMIRTGFSRRMAGAVESVASCGGQIMPPIMGASVFIMSDIIGVPYVQLMLFGLVPALLYFVSLSSSIYFEASRINISTLNKEEIPNAWEQVRRGGYLLIPVFILLASIISGETPGRAGFKAVMALIVMVDLVRSLRWIRSRFGTGGVVAAAFILITVLILVYGPVNRPEFLTGSLELPGIGEVDGVKFGLFVLGLGFVLVPGSRGMPYLFPMALSLANWKIPSELLWLGQLPIVGMALPVLLIAGLGYLIALPVFVEETPKSSNESSRELADSMIRALEKGAKNSLSLVAATSAIGLIVGLLVVAALGVRISIFVTEVATFSLFLALVLVMLSSLVLGMGLPTIAAYILLVIVVAPALKDLGTSLIAAHMFIFYFGVISSITPPVALAAYGASGISGANAMQTAFVACRLAITAFIAPFLFVYHPELLLIDGTGFEIAYRIGVSLVGILFVSMGAMGYGIRQLTALERSICMLLALMLFLDVIIVNIGGLLLGVLFVWYQKTNRNRNEDSN